MLGWTETFNTILKCSLFVVMQGAWASSGKKIMASPGFTVMSSEGLSL